MKLYSYDLQHLHSRLSNGSSQKIFCTIPTRAQQCNTINVNFNGNKLIFFSKDIVSKMQRSNVSLSMRPTYTTPFTRRRLVATPPIESNFFIAVHSSLPLSFPYRHQIFRRLCTLPEKEAVKTFPELQ